MSENRCNCMDEPSEDEARRRRMAAWIAKTDAEARAAAERIGMTFPKPTVRSHGLVGEGSTVEREQ